MKKEKLKGKLLMIMFFYEYADYLEKTKEKDFNEKLQKQLEKDKELSAEKWIEKYKPLWLKIKDDEEFNKYLEERPLIECGCGSANVKCMRLGNFNKYFDIKMYKFKCFSCGKSFESYINEKGEVYQRR